VVPKGNRFATLMAVKRSNFSGDLGAETGGLAGGNQDGRRTRC